MKLLAMLGAMLFAAGFVLFFVFSRSDGSLYAWSLGPLFWLVGGVLIVGWALNRTLTPKATVRLVPNRRDEPLPRAA